MNLLGRYDSLKELTLNNFIPTDDFFKAINALSNLEVLELENA